MKVGIGSLRYDILKAYGTKCDEVRSDKHLLIYTCLDSGDEYQFYFYLEDQVVTKIKYIWEP